MAVDRLFLERAYELAARAIGNTAPNPPVGAVVVKDGRIVGEGYHHRAGQAHAEAQALAQAGVAAHDATLYVSLEPCAHSGLVAACAPAVAHAGVARVVIGTLDPNPKNHGLGVKLLCESGIAVETTADRRAQRLIETFAGFIASDRPYVALKMAMSLDGAVAAEPAVREWITSPSEQLFVRQLRIEYDAVLVGARTVRIDDPQLTVRPAYHRLRPFVRIVACQTQTVPASSRIFAPVQDYARTMVLAPAALRERLHELGEVADPLLVGGDRDARLNLERAMKLLRERGITSVLCEGGPTLAARLVEAGMVDRFYWAIAPRMLSNERAVRVLTGVDLAALRPKLRFDRVERVGEDVVLSGTVEHV